MLSFVATRQAIPVFFNVFVRGDHLLRVVDEAVPGCLRSGIAGEPARRGEGVDVIVRRRPSRRGAGGRRSRSGSLARPRRRRRDSLGIPRRRRRDSLGSPRRSCRRRARLSSAVCDVVVGPIPLGGLFSCLKIDIYITVGLPYISCIRIFVTDSSPPYSPSSASSSSSCSWRT